MRSIAIAQILAPFTQVVLGDSIESLAQVATKRHPMQVDFRIRVDSAYRDSATLGNPIMLQYRLSESIMPLD